MKAALIVFLQKERFQETLDLLWRALDGTPRPVFARVYLVSAGVRLVNKTEIPAKWQNTTIPFAPNELLHSAGSTNVEYLSLVEYLNGTLLTSIVSKQGFDRVALAWPPVAWPSFMAAGGAMRARYDVRWWDPAVRTWVDDESIGPAIVSGGRSPVSGSPLNKLVGDSPQMETLRNHIKRRAPLPFPVLLVGETGTGKELCARALHAESGRDGDFRPVNAAMLSPEFFESELFGHVKGAYTGANSDRAGRIREARGGTFFLDELGSTPLHVQSRLLRAFNDVNEGIIEVRPMGAGENTKPEHVRVRLVTAVQQIDTNLRIDLRYRVQGVLIRVPRLRERGDDVIQLGERFVADLRRQVQDGPTRLADDASDVLRGHEWPGNVRELETTIRQAWLLSHDEGADQVGGKAIRDALVEASVPSGSSSAANLRVRFAAEAAAAAKAARERFPSSGAAAARSLGMDNKQDLDRYVKKLEMDARRPRKPK